MTTYKDYAQGLYSHALYVADQLYLDLKALKETFDDAGLTFPPSPGMEEYEKFKGAK